MTQWRTSPVVIDVNGDALNDLVMLDHEGYLALFERVTLAREARLLPGRRIFVDESGQPLRLNPNRAGKSGRRKFVMTDWDGDGKVDILINGRNIDFMRNVADRTGQYVFKNLGPLDRRRLAGHTTCPAVVDWNRDRIPDLLIGAEDGFFYYLRNSGER